MKRLVLIIIPALICGVVFTSCSAERAEKDEQDEQFPEEQTAMDIVKDIRYIRSSGYIGLSHESGRYPYFSGSGHYWEYYNYFVLKTDTERDDYITRMKEEIKARVLYWEFTGVPKLALALNEYDNMFFSNYNLVMILLAESSGGNRHEVEIADVRNNELNILIKRFPWGLTCDMAYWHILIPIRKEYFDGKIVNVNIVNDILNGS